MSAHPAELRTLHLAMLDAVLVGSGLGAVATLAARECGGPVALIVPRLEIAAGSEGLGPGELGRLRGYALARCAGRVAPVPPGVVAEIPILSGEELQGVVLLLGAAAPAEATLERLRLVSVAALTEIALARSAAAPDEGASVTLLDALASGASPSREEIVRRAARAGCDLRGGAIAVCCALEVDRPHHVAALVRDDWPGALAQHVLGLETGSSRLHALLPLRAAPPAGVAALADRLARHGPVGVSEPCSDPGELGRAMQAAALALDLGDGTGVAVADLGGVRERYEATVAPLVRYDAQYGTELVDTLHRVIAAGGDADGVALDLGVPPHRVRYRLEKARELSGLDAGTPPGRRALSLGLRCYRVVAPALPG
jgi:PucR C-terminal helix-turn-helix domain/GGDEF-like domain